MNPSAVSYLKFIAARPSREPMQYLDPVEQRVIDLLCFRWSRNEKPTVLEAMQVAPKAISLSTVHRRLKSLRAKGFLELITDERDSRMKYVMPTAMLIQTFELMGEAMRQAVQPQPGE